jgi:hypothetical protein
MNRAVTSATIPIAVRGSVSTCERLRARDARHSRRRIVNRLDEALPHHRIAVPRLRDPSLVAIRSIHATGRV